jgi:hypothetical protein
MPHGRTSATGSKARRTAGAKVRRPAGAKARRPAKTGRGPAEARHGRRTAKARHGRRTEWKGERGTRYVYCSAENHAGGHSQKGFAQHSISPSIPLRT